MHILGAHARKVFLIGLWIKTCRPFLNKEHITFTKQSSIVLKVWKLSCTEISFHRIIELSKFYEPH